VGVQNANVTLNFSRTRGSDFYEREVIQKLCAKLCVTRHWRKEWVDNSAGWEANDYVDVWCSRVRQVHM